MTGYDDLTHLLPRDAADLLGEPEALLGLHEAQGELHPLRTAAGTALYRVDELRAILARHP